MRIAILLVSLAALALAATMAALGPGTRFGLWEFPAAFGVMRLIAVPLLIAAGAAGIAFLLSAWKARGLALLAFTAFVAASAAAWVPLKMRALFEANPFIHDVTTDFEDPPEIRAAADLPRSNPPEYVGDETVGGTDMTVAEAQMAAFPELVPLFVEADLERTVAAARSVLADMGLEVIAEGPASEAAGGGWRIEAVATSFWYGFRDDFVVRLRLADDGRTRVDVRSKSRVGGSDLGANARRTRTFLEKLDAAL